MSIGWCLSVCLPLPMSLPVCFCPSVAVFVPVCQLAFHSSVFVSVSMSVCPLSLTPLPPFLLSLPYPSLSLTPLPPLPLSLLSPCAHAYVCTIYTVKRHTYVCTTYTVNRHTFTQLLKHRTYISLQGNRWLCALH